MAAPSSMARERIAIALAIAAAGCGRSDAPSGPVPEGKPLAGKAFYRIDAAPAAACTQGAPCEAKLVLTALGTYHVNQDYPFKFVGDPAPATPIDGEGRFALGDARHGTMTLTFKPAA